MFTLLHLLFSHFSLVLTPKYSLLYTWVIKIFFLTWKALVRERKKDSMAYFLTMT
jgi:hypothetical protein